jgi:peptidoglycan/LPS O-acetylase OafA/YrhL
LGKPRLEIPGLTGMRGLAAMYVMLFHFLDSPSGVIPAWLNWFSGVGWSGVDFFFVLSGYLLATIYSEPTTQYFVRRIFRTFPLYYASLPLYVIAGFIAFSPLYLIYAQDFFYQTFSNSALWTLTLEEMFYFLIFPIVLVLRIRSRYLIVAGLASLLLWSLLPDTRILNEQMPEYFICYAIGIFLAKNGAKITAKIRPTRLIAVLVIGLFLASDLVMWFPLGGNELSPIHPLMYSGVYGLAILFMRQSILFTNPLSYFLGKISYGVYILQMPILWMIAHPADVLFVGPAVLSLHLTIFESVPLAACITLAASTASYYLFESPLISIGRRVTNR